MVVGLVGLFGMRDVGTKLQATIESGPLIHAAMEMKMAVANDLQLFKSLEAAQWPDEVEAKWSEHEKIAVKFTALGKAILNGGEMEAGKVEATKDERLQQVVANEIKELSQQTAQATHEIKAKIGSIRHSTDETAGEMKQISEVINQVNEIVATIATSVDSQLSTTEEVAGNVREVSLGFGEINENVAQCSQVTGRISADIADVKSSADELT